MIGRAHPKGAIARDVVVGGPQGRPLPHLRKRMGVAVADRDTRVNQLAAGNPGEVDTDRPLGRVADAHQGG